MKTKPYQFEPYDILQISYDGNTWEQFASIKDARDAASAVRFVTDVTTSAGGKLCHFRIVTADCQTVKLSR